MTAPLPPAIPAATLVIVRDRADGPPELLMVERAGSMAFAAGALVFPGGRIDPDDHHLARTLPHGMPDLEEVAARIAAIRETIEEVGLAIGLVPAPSPAVLASVRAALHAGVRFSDVLSEAGLTFDLDVLTAFARWRPGDAHRRIFDTRFYLARLPADAPEPSVDATENVRLHWATARHTLDAADAGHSRIIFPTRRNLERLAQFTDFAAAIANARAFPVRMVTPWIERRGGVDHLCIPDDLGYPVTSEPLADVVRG